MHRFTNPPHLDLKVYDPHCPYGPNVLSEHDPLAISLHDRASYERACALFGIAPKSDREIMSLAEVYDHEEFPPEAWACLARNGRVAFRLDSVYYFETLRETRADEEWRRDHPEPGRGVAQDRTGGRNIREGRHATGSGDGFQDRQRTIITEVSR